ncbi:MAG: [protein-PII] uridylyltransferase, partial [Alphaproteobacteria bacterium]
TGRGRARAAAMTARAATRTAPAGRQTALARRLKQALAKARAETAAALDRNEPGDRVTAGLSRAMDRVVRDVMDHATAEAVPARAHAARDALAVLALGGYGRGQLAPHSDVDLLFLTAPRASVRARRVVAFALHALWDLGLKVGHATRDVDDCLARARANMTIRTALLEARAVWGDAELARGLRARFQRELVAGTEAEFLAAKLAEREARIARFGATRFLVEPNVKEGIGALRDLDLLGWLALYRRRRPKRGDLGPLGAKPGREARRLLRARVFLLTVRCHLHHLAGRAEDRLGFDVQPEIARRMGYRDRRSNRAVERFMKRYFLATKEVGDLVGQITAALEEATEGDAPRPQPIAGRDGTGLVLLGRRLAASPGALRDDPVAVIRLFHEAQARGLAIHPATLRSAAQAASRIDDAVRADAAANALFLDVLASRAGAEATLRAMSETGVLARFVPDFGRVVAQMQYDRYHAYTVDEHTIRAIAMLAAVERGEHIAELPLATELFPKIRSRRALYLAVFMHDIAKGRGTDHSELGGALAEALARRLGLDDEEAETAGWLVRHHLAFSRTAFKRDVNDAKTVEDFVALVQSVERLRLLLLLTVADIRATNPAVWNGWKGQLLRDLYWRAEEVVSGGHVAEHKRARVEDARDRLRSALADWSDADFAAYTARHFPPYWLSFDTDAHARHARLLALRDRDAAGTAVAHRIDRFRDVTEVSVATADRQGLFASLAGAIAAAGASIADAKIYTLADGVALDTFWIQDHARHAFDEPRRLARLDELILGVLAGRIDLARELAKRRRPSWAARPALPIAPRVLIDNDASTKHTVIEVNGRDRPGLLHDVTLALARQRLSIVTARISTYGDRVVDVFYVRDRFGLKVTHPASLAQLRQRLLAVFDDAPGGTATAA